MTPNENATSRAGDKAQHEERVREKEAAFAEFCETNRVATLPPRPASDEEMAWTLREASRLDTPHGQD